MDEHRDIPAAPSQVAMAPRKRGLGAGWIVAIIFGVLFLLAVPCGFLGLGIMLPALSVSRQNALEVRSQTQMRGIFQSMVIYAQNNRDFYPPADTWRDVLVDGGWVPPNQLLSPASDGVGDDFFFVPAKTNTSLGASPTRIVLYEDPGHHPRGVAVVFADGHTEMVPHDRFELLLEASASSPADSP